MPYRLAVDRDDPDNPVIVYDAAGQDKLTVLYEQLRYHVVRASYHTSQTERVLNEIESERGM